MVPKSRLFLTIIKIVACIPFGSNVGYYAKIVINYFNSHYGCWLFDNCTLYRSLHFCCNR